MSVTGTKDVKATKQDDEDTRVVMTSTATNADNVVMRVILMIAVGYRLALVPIKV